MFLLIQHPRLKWCCHLVAPLQQNRDAHYSDNLTGFCFSCKIFLLPSEEIIEERSAQESQAITMNTIELNPRIKRMHQHKIGSLVWAKYCELWKANEMHTWQQIYPRKRIVVLKTGMILFWYPAMFWSLMSQKMVSVKECFTTSFKITDKGLISRLHRAPLPWKREEGTGHRNWHPHFSPSQTHLKRYRIQYVHLRNSAQRKSDFNQQNIKRKCQ